MLPSKELANGPTHSKSAMTEDSVRALSQYIVNEFFRQTGLSVPAGQSEQDGPVGQQVHTEMQCWNLRDISPHRLQKHIVTSINYATTTFGHNRLDTQVHIALFTVLCLCVDDLEVDSVALEEFVPRFQTGREQLHPVLSLLVEKLQRMPDFYHLYAASAIVAGTIHFINCTLFDKQYEDMKLHSKALPFVLYKRARNSLGEVYASCVWDKFNFPELSTHVQVMPETMIYLDYANDILSFYKEELVGETNNFVHDRVHVTGKDVKGALLDILNETVNAVARARLILQGEKERAIWERFLQGYVAFHFLSPRYKLAALTGRQ